MRWYETIFWLVLAVGVRIAGGKEWADVNTLVVFFAFLARTMWLTSRGRLQAEDHTFDSIAKKKLGP